MSGSLERTKQAITMHMMKILTPDFIFTEDTDGEDGRNVVPSMI